MQYFAYQKINCKRNFYFFSIFLTLANIDFYDFFALISSATFEGTGS